MRIHEGCELIKTALGQLEIRGRASAQRPPRESGARAGPSTEPAHSGRPGSQGPRPDAAPSQPTAATPGISWPFQLQFLAVPAPGGSLRPCLLTSGAAEPRSHFPSGVAGGETEAGLWVPAQGDAGLPTAGASAGFGPGPWWRWWLQKAGFSAIWRIPGWDPPFPERSLAMHSAASRVPARSPEQAGREGASSRGPSQVPVRAEA